MTIHINKAGKVLSRKRVALTTGRGWFDPDAAEQFNESTTHDGASRASTRPARTATCTRRDESLYGSGVGL